MKISLSDAKKRSVFNNLTIYDLLADSNLRFDFVIAEINGIHPFVVNNISERVYFILEGSGEVIVGDENYQLNSQDLVFIPKGVPHSIRGTFKYIIITSPPFDPKNEQVLEEIK